MIKTVTETYNINPIEAVLSHNLEKHSIDGTHSIVSKDSYDNKVDKHEFGLNEVWALNIVVSSGEGKAKESDARTTVFKRAIEK